MREKSEQTRSRIINAAIDEMQKKGYQKSSMRSIADKAGVTAGAMYWYFDGKEQLFESICDDIIGELYVKQKKMLPDNLEDFTDSELLDLFYQEASLQMFRNMQEYIPILCMIFNNGNPYYYQKKKREYVEFSADYAKRFYDELYKRKLSGKTYSYEEVSMLCQAEFSVICNLLESDEILNGVNDKMMQSIQTLFCIIRYGLEEDLKLKSKSGKEGK